MFTISADAQNKCTRYWPDVEDKKTYGKVQVENLKETVNPHYILREFLVYHEEVRHGREVRHVAVPDRNRILFHRVFQAHH